LLQLTFILLFTGLEAGSQQIVWRIYFNSPVRGAPAVFSS
jgi:hypothetical protein